MIARFFEVLDHFPEKGERGEDADLVPGRSTSVSLGRGM